MENIDFNNECWICGVHETYNVCPDCGVTIYLDKGVGDNNAILSHLEKVNPERFKQMVKQAEEINHKT